MANKSVESIGSSQKVIFAESRILFWTILNIKDGSSKFIPLPSF
jgi:hypothetical protein